MPPVFILESALSHVFFIWLSIGFWSHRTSNNTCKSQNRSHVRQHLQKFLSNRYSERLCLYLYCIRQPKEKTCKQSSNRMPFAEYHSRQSYESFSSRHAFPEKAYCAY